MIDQENKNNPTKPPKEIIGSKRLVKYLAIISS